jgi:hypothetical protein
MITKLKKNEVFVFGSNLNGAHAGGAALTAYAATAAAYAGRKQISSKIDAWFAERIKTLETV